MTFLGRGTPVELREETLPEIPPLADGFDLARLRCESEARIAQMLQKDESLQQRLLAACEGRTESLVQGKLSLLTGAYRVAEPITPTLYKLVGSVKEALRLVQPLDLYVRATEERNAFCLPSRSGKRLIMCLNSGLVEAMSLHELTSVMGHEAGHAILGHGKMPRIPFGHPDFSFLEIARLRALDRRQELSCDRIGLIASGDVRVSCRGLFKLACGLSDRWIEFDEAVYANLSVRRLS
jgi:Peptidase family M48